MLSSPAIDCHVHVFDPDRFPYKPNRRYTPPSATVAGLAAMHATLPLDVSRSVLVQPSVYGTDNRCLLDALRQLNGNARGVAVIDDDITDRALDELDAHGVRGVRINLRVAGEPDIASAENRVRSQAARVAERGWSVGINASLKTLAGIARLLETLPQRIVLDHFGHAVADDGLDQPGFADLRALARCPNVYVKMPAPYLISTAAPDYLDVDPLARALIEAAPDRIVWGSNWPHTAGSRARKNSDPGGVERFRDEDDLGNFECALRWMRDDETRHQILSSNPARLYGFEAQ